MQFARPPRPPHDDHRSGNAGPVGPCGNGNGRLTLLLSTAPWRPTPWADALPAVLAPMGVTAVRTTSARQAERIIRSTEVHLAVVDLSTPMDDFTPGTAEPAHIEEAGSRILELLSRLHMAPPTVVLKSPRQARDEHRTVHHALRCNAFAVVDRTAADLETMLNVMQRVLCRFYQDRWPSPPMPPTPPFPPSNFV